MSDNRIHPHSHQATSSHKVSSKDPYPRSLDTMKNGTITAVNPIFIDAIPANSRAARQAAESRPKLGGRASQHLPEEGGTTDADAAAHRHFHHRPFNTLVAPRIHRTTPH